MAMRIYETGRDQTSLCIDVSVEVGGRQLRCPHFLASANNIGNAIALNDQIAGKTCASRSVNDEPVGNQRTHCVRPLPR